MKSLFVALGIYKGLGGMEQFNQRVVRCLSELGVSENLESGTIALWDSDSSSAPEPVRFLCGNAGKLRTAVAFLLRIWRMQPDVVLYGHILLAPMACAARLLSPRSKHILFVHGREVWREPFRTRIPKWERLTARVLMDRVVSVSRCTARRMASAYGISDNRFRILSNAVDMPHDSPSAPLKRESQNGEFRLLTVTRLGYGERYKGCDKVIRALPGILSSFPNTRYEIVGRGPLRHELRRLASELGVGAHVQCPGYLNSQQLEQAYRNADVLVMPSIGEGFGIVFLEAWKYGLPVVAGNQDASAEVVTHGLNGLCINPDSLEEITGAITALLQDRDRALRMGETGYRTILERYTHAHFRQRLAGILHES